MRRVTSLAVPHIYPNPGISKLTRAEGCDAEGAGGLAPSLFLIRNARMSYRRKRAVCISDVTGIRRPMYGSWPRMIVENSDKAVCFLIQEGDKAKVVIAKGVAEQL